MDPVKRYNASLGHQAGDRALVLMAGVVARHARRPHDVAARFGGDEFATILPGVDAAAGARVAESLLEDIRGLSLDAPDDPARITATLDVHSALPGGGPHQQRPRVLRAGRCRAIPGQGRRTQRLCQQRQRAAAPYHCEW